MAGREGNSVTRVLGYTSYNGGGVTMGGFDAIRVHDRNIRVTDFAGFLGGMYGSDAYTGGGLTGGNGGNRGVGLGATPGLGSSVSSVASCSNPVFDFIRLLFTHEEFCRAPEIAGARTAKGPPHWLQTRPAFRPASRRTALASRLCYRKHFTNTL